MSKTYSIELEIAGPTAMWTRPDTGDAPVSYLAPTFSAAKGILESICWLKSAVVKPTTIDICTPPVWHTYTTNYGGPLRKSSSVKEGNSFQLLATVLINVCYRIHADVVNVEHERGQSEQSRRYRENNINGAHAYQEMFERRLNRGQWFSMPSLGWREFVPDYVGPFREASRPCVDVNARLPSMLRSVFSESSQGTYDPSFDQDVEIREGVLRYA
ncbi:MAG: CRISPR-associated protein Cas5 [Planctomycetales bacterium]|nr:CRISPR-associated protein Cas5 [Planctomycetales bacterium]